jgi:hypothetical protein
MSSAHTTTLFTGKDMAKLSLITKQNYGQERSRILPVIPRQEIKDCEA